MCYNYYYYYCIPVNKKCNHNWDGHSHGAWLSGSPCITK